jgi:hypothetical protein
MRNLLKADVLKLKKGDGSYIPSPFFDFTGAFKWMKKLLSMPQNPAAALLHKPV